jgi:1,4-alpha-glucan branching enzyme
MSKHQRTAVAASRTKPYKLSLVAPGATVVAVTGNFCDWSPDGRPLRPDRHGVWTTTLNLPPGRYEYRFLIDGQWHDDPACTERVPNPFGTQNCVFRV